MADFNIGKRYYPSPSEQNLLVMGLLRYFALPERSEARSMVVKEVSGTLRCFSPHWGHRAVRLWFNNNRRSYMSDGEVADPPTQDAPQTVPFAGLRPVEHSSIPVSMYAPSDGGMPLTRIPGPSVHDSMPIPVPHSFDTNKQVVRPPLSFGRREPNAAPSQQQLQQPAPVTDFRRMSPMSVGKTGSHGRDIETCYSVAMRSFRELKEDPNSSNITAFDAACNSLIAEFGTINPKRVDTQVELVSCPTPAGMSQTEDMMDKSLERTYSLDQLDGVTRSHSYMQHLYACGTASNDPAPTSVWQTPSFADMNVLFEATAISDNVAACTHATNQHCTVFVNRYHESKQVWDVVIVEMQGCVESMAVSDDYAWLLTNETIYRSSLVRGQGAMNANIPIVAGNRVIVPFGDGGAIAGFSGSGDLIVLHDSMNTSVIHTPYRGITSLTPWGRRIICSVIGSSVVRIVDVSGEESQLCIGHCGPVMGVTTLSEAMFASQGDDKTVRVWDSRYQWPCISIDCPDSVAKIAGSCNFLVSALHNKSITGFDLRRPECKAIIAVATQEYETMDLFYNEEEDAIAMFGIVDKNRTKDSIMFKDSNGQSRRRIFRLYNDFMSLNNT